MSNTINTTIKFPNVILANAHLLADELDTNRSQVIIKGTEWITAFDAQAINSIPKIAGEVQLGEAEFIRCAVLRMIAEHNAQLETYGSIKPETLLDYAKGDPGEVYQYFRQRFVEQYEKEILKTVIEDEANDMCDIMSDIQKRIAIKFHYGRSWLESEEYAGEQRRQAELERLMAERDSGEKN